jgi:prophage regulatory protein
VFVSASPETNQTREVISMTARKKDFSGTLQSSTICQKAQSAPEAEDTILRPAKVAERLGVARGTIYRWFNEGPFPRPIKLGGGSVGWLASEVNQWITEQAAASRRTA